MARGDSVVEIDNLDDYYDVSLKQARPAKLAEAEGERFTFHRVDFADRTALAAAMDGRHFERIVHLGEQAGVSYSIENPHA